MKFFKKFIQKRRCEHEYQKIDTDVSLQCVMYYILYCPKCDKEKRVNAEKYDREQTKKQLRKDYE